MKFVAKFIGVVVAPMLLTGCLFLPGKFDATLKLHQGGKYEFTYVGEMQIVSGDDKDMSPPKLEPFDKNNARCNDWIEGDGTKTPNVYYDNYSEPTEVAVSEAEAATDGDEVSPRRVKRDCTKDELAELEQQQIETYERRKEDYEQRTGMMASMFGGAVPGNDEALKKFAAQLMKYDGWEKGEYVGNNKFDVEYRAAGTFDRYFAFPILNDAAMQYPFFQIVPRKSGELEVMSPAVGGSNSFLSLAMIGGMRGGNNKDMPMSEISGSFTLETDGEVLANNGPDGYETNGSTKTIRWDVKGLKESPRALIRLK